MAKKPAPAKPPAPPGRKFRSVSFRTDTVMMESLEAAAQERGVTVSALLRNLAANFIKPGSVKM